MKKTIFSKLRQLCRHTGGNATLLVALGMPALIGGAGLAVDTAQWYMWKRELQYAVDQAAMAGAWARTTDAMRDSYTTRARQEYTTNLSQTRSFAVQSPNVSLANYAGGSLNSVAVSATATRSLPFSSFLTGRSATIYAYAQASFKKGANFTSCLVATDPTQDGAITVGGNAVLTAGCGMAALSTSDSSIVVTGNPTVDFGFILSAGGIDDWFDTHTDDEIHEYLTGLKDPYASLNPPSPPSSQTPRTYNCVKGTTSTTADVTTNTVTTYAYYRGPSESNSNPYAYASAKADTNLTTGPNNITVPNGTTAGTSTSVQVTWTRIAGSGGNSIWEVRTSTVTTTYAHVVSTTTQTQASLIPGTYSGGFKVSCTTTLSSGIYVIDGGGVDIDGQYNVTGSGVMFVLKNGAYIKINGGSNINLTAPTAAELMAQGVSASDANKLAGMLVFEDRSSPGSSKSTINGNASTVLNGTIYLPVSNLTFSGTATVTSQCLMIAADSITITGTADMTTFCPAGQNTTTEVGSSAGSVRLVA